MTKRSKKTHPQAKYSERPFRLWDPVEKSNWPRRYYASLEKAEDMASLLARKELHVGAVIEVYHAHYGRLFATFRHSAKGTIQFNRIRKE